MPYLPKNKYNKKTAGKGEFEIKLTGKPYSGDYIELSDGTFQAGTKYRQGFLIVPISKLSTPNTYKVNNKGLTLDIQTRKNAFNYSKLKKKILKEQDNFSPIYTTYPTPTTKEYKKGQFRRYFCRRKNTLNEYKEINKEIFESIDKEDGTYDHNLYEVGFTPWVLTDNNIIANDKLVKNINRAFPNVGSILFSNLGEYYLPDSLFKPKTQLDEISADDNLLNLNYEEEIKQIPISGEDPRLEKTKLKIIEEVESISRNRTKHTPKTSVRLKPSKGLKNKLKSKRGTSSRKGSSGGGSSGGGGGGY